MYRQMTNTKSWLMSGMVSNTKKSCAQSKRRKKNGTSNRRCKERKKGTKQFQKKSNSNMRDVRSMSRSGWFKWFNGQGPMQERE